MLSERFRRVCHQVNKDGVVVVWGEVRVGGVVVANNTNFVNSRMMELFIGGCPRCRVVGLSGLACTNGLTGLGSVRSGPGCAFIGNSVYSFSLVLGLVRSCGISNVVRLTTRDRMSEDVGSPFAFTRAGIVKALSLLRTTGVC